MIGFWTKIKDFYEKYEGRISSLALLGGFIFDSLTLQRIDLLFENIVIISYLTLSGGGIILFNYLGRMSYRPKFVENLYRFLPLFIQFAFGGLFSGFFIFYSRSATLSASWPFVLILLILLIGNESFRERYQKITFQFSIYFVAIFSFSIFFVPILVKSIGTLVFILSGFVSLVFIYFFIYILSRIVPESFRENKGSLITSVVSLFVLINILYFSNLIPPIPLSLKDAGAYYSVERAGNSYIALSGDKKWYQFFAKDKLYIDEGGDAYVFSSVFAPTDLNTKIIHNWQYFDSPRGDWLSLSKVSFPISGGRDEGYRGFSKKSNIFPGKWRVDIETENGQIIGRVKFRVEEKNSPPELKTKSL